MVPQAPAVLEAPVTRTGTASPTDDYVVRHSPSRILTGFLAAYAMFMDDFVDFAGLVNRDIEDVDNKVPMRMAILRERLSPTRCKAVWRVRSQPGWRGLKRKNRDRGRL